ncbi:CBS domain containing protein [Magnetococcus marinus MC-1]|uniref:CBS domain containing protein n=1 Tax=Magnetococcus marinus (strain ATCC BAA-1437 / JCM 17883 / MC-1) TaxID=156889 RepID=A0L501_MAGMM|nr:CNNM domain-containing protein [Magnetococcus marinus]ABK43044.1 CBS domain containing protein [Magnetococcus marinus MC-1]
MDGSTLLPVFTTQELEFALRILLQVFLMIAAAMFSGSETALFSLSRLDLQKLRTTRNPYSDRIHEMLDEPRRLIISILCGNELLNIASSSNMAAILLLSFGSEDVGLLNVLVMVPLLLLVAEVTPKTFAVTFPIKFSTRISARILPKWIIFISPLRETIRLIADRITTLIVGEQVQQENILQKDEFRTLVEEGADHGALDASERVLIDNMLEASETEVLHIMTPRTRLHLLNANDPLPKILKRFRKYRHPRVPVIRGHADNILGMLHSEDVLRLLRSQRPLEEVRIEELLRPVHYVPPTKTVDEMFDYFQAHNTRAAIILGEYGGVTGIVTMKDVLTFIFGEISGAGKSKAYYKEKDNNIYIIPGDMRLIDFEDLTAFGIDDSMMTTIGGVAFRLFDRLPKVGDALVNDGLRFTVLEMDGLRIKTLRVGKSSVDNGLPDEQEAPHPLESPSTVEVDESGHAPTDHGSADAEQQVLLRDDEEPEAASEVSLMEAARANPEETACEKPEETAREKPDESPVAETPVVAAETQTPAPTKVKSKKRKAAALEKELHTPDAPTATPSGEV